MIQHYQNKANAGIGTGLILSIGARVAAWSLVKSPDDAAIALALSAVNLVGVAIFIYGCVMYAKAKDRNGWWGAFGLLSLIGLIVLLCLKDFAPNGASQQARGFSPVMHDPPPPPSRL